MAQLLVGRERERDVLTGIVDAVGEGAGGMVLVAGDAGSGKTTLVESVLSDANLRVLRGPARGANPAPYEPLLTALRQHLRHCPVEEAADASGWPASLALVLPELGPAPATAAPDLVPGAIRAAFEKVAADGATIVFLDDLQWADAATLSLLGEWAGGWSPTPLVVVGAYRSDELPRRHPIRALRATLRRASSPSHDRHLRLSPLDPDDSARMVAQVLGNTSRPEVVDAICRRARGLPFYLEELARAIVDAGTERPSGEVPETIRDAVLLRLDRLSASARTAAEIAAAARPSLPLEVLADLADEDAVDELLDSGLLVEPSADGGRPHEVVFRHALVGEAMYAATPWTRRRRQHRALAAALEARGARPAAVAAQWTQAHEHLRARPLLLEAAEEAHRIHAYRDAKDVIEQALAAWPPDEDPSRIRALDRLGLCAQRCGELTDAARAWEEVAAAHAATGDHAALADVQRRLAGVHDLTRSWTRALSVRTTAAEEFARAGQPGEAATELLAVATHLEDAGDLTGALRAVKQAWAHIDGDPVTGLPERRSVELRAHATALEGLIRAALGEGSSSLDLTRQAMDLAFDLGLEPLIATVYSLHAYALDQAAEYPDAVEALTDAFGYCRSHGLEGEAQVCLACLMPTLRHVGQWDRALEVGREVLATTDAPEPALMVARGETGLILANRGRAVAARRHLAAAATFSRADELFGLEVEASWGLARVHELEGDVDGASAALRELTARCLDRDDRRWSTAALRWGTTLFGRHRRPRELGACTDALARNAAATGTVETTAALAHALGETALLDGDAQRAADQFERTLELLRGLGLPPETAETQVRAGVALAAVGDHDGACDRLAGAYHTARTLGARPLMAEARRQLEDLGTDLAARLGERAVDRDLAVGLTPREQEVLRLVATGRTNREIAADLFLSTRTIDMHVRNLLAKLDCRTRTEAVHRASDLRLLGDAS